MFPDIGFKRFTFPSASEVSPVCFCGLMCRIFKGMVTLAFGSPNVAACLVQNHLRHL